MAKRIAIIGSGIGGLGTACLLAKAGHRVTIFEKNDQVGGRAGVIKAKGFTFDAGPSWYLMPDVFERFFKLLEQDVNDLLKLKRLQPSFRVNFSEGKPVDIYSDPLKDNRAFENIEPGAGSQLGKYLKKSKHLYNQAVDHFLYREYASARDFLSPTLIAKASRLKLLGSLHADVSRYFNDERLRQILEYPAVFLGGSPYKIPAFYGLLNHVVMHQGVLYPQGGLNQVTTALQKIAKLHGVKIKLNVPVQMIVTRDGVACGVKVGGKQLEFDAVVSNADRHHTETALLAPHERDHSPRYWQKRTVAPSALLIYLGVNRRYANLRHHNLLFTKDWAKNFKQLFKSNNWPDDPSLYVCAPSRTDPTVAPKGHENMFVLVPISAGIKYTDKQLNSFADKVLATIESELKLPDLRQHIVYKKLFCVKDFASQFNSFQGTGLGLSHTLGQSAVFRPGHNSKKVKNLYYVGADTHPGIGLPSCLIAAELVARRILEAK